MNRLLFKSLCWLVAAVFMIEQFVNPRLAQAQTVPLTNTSTVVASHASADLPMLRGLRFNPQDGLDLSFIVDSGNAHDESRTTNDEHLKLIKYFLTALAIPEKDLWVNLSPYEKDRITSDALSQTEMGRQLLAQDYILKKITSSLISPEGESGKKFWDKVYERMYDAAAETQNFASLQDSIDAFHKIWITPDSAEVFAQGHTVLILNSRLKVMLESDYWAKQRAVSLRGAEGDEAIADKVNSDEIASQKTLAITNHVKSIMRDVILPIIEDEVNNGESFAPLRQIYRALILARWYKDNLKQSLLGQVYADQSKMEGINAAPRTTHAALEEIYQQYLAAFNAGAEGVIKEVYDAATQSMIARKYITGGFAVNAGFHPQQRTGRKVDFTSLSGAHLLLRIPLKLLDDQAR